MPTEDKRTVHVHVDLRFEPFDTETRNQHLNELYEAGYHTTYSGPGMTEKSFPKGTGRGHVKASAELDIDVRTIENLQQLQDAFVSLYRWCDKNVRSLDIEPLLTGAEEAFEACGVELPEDVSYTCLRRIRNVWRSAYEACCHHLA